MERIVTIFKKVEWENLDILNLIREAVREAREEAPETKELKLGDIGIKRVGNHLQLNLYFLDPPKTKHKGTVRPCTLPKAQL